MSRAACKAALCSSNMKATLETVDSFRAVDEFDDEQLEEMAKVMDKANKKIQAIALIPASDL